MSDVKLDDIVSLCKRRGFIFQGSEIYGGLAGTWDYGPLGVALKRNIMDLWWDMFVNQRDDMYGVDAAILMNQKVWQASGHVDTFTDPITVCNNCSNRFRVDKLVDNDERYKNFTEKSLKHFFDSQQNRFNEEEKLAAALRESHLALSKQVDADIEEWNKLQAANVSSEVYYEWLVKATERIKEDNKHIRTQIETYEMLAAYQALLDYLKNKIQETKNYLGEFAQIYLNTTTNCEVCGKRDWSVPVRFNMMFKTSIGPVNDESSVSYLRPETAQGIFTNFKNIVDTFYPDLPFGIAQFGKAFRNEISPRDFVFRSREFEQMEIEYFIHPDKWEAAFEQWRKDVWAFLKQLGLSEDNVHELDVPKDELAHYSKRTIDFEFDFPHKRDELLGLAYRTDFDLKNHQEHSGKNMEYRPKEGGEAFIPHVIEPSFGVERAVMAVLTSAYTEDEVNGEKRVFLKLPAHLAPVKVAVSPLLKNKPELADKAREVYKSLKQEFGNVMYDDNGNIGKRYRRQDEIGTPYCVTIDFETLENNTVTVRNRDTTEQERIAINSLASKLAT